MRKKIEQQYSQFLVSIKERIRKAQYDALKAVNEGLTNLNETVPEKFRNQDIFDFLELGEEHSERELEAAIVTRMDRFLREMGGTVTFVGRSLI